LLAAAACCFAQAAHAADPAMFSKEIGIDPQKDLPDTHLFEDVVVAPIPISNSGGRLYLERKLGRRRAAVDAAARRRGVGPVAVFDTRDNEMNPSAGVLIDFRGNFAEHNLGSDVDYCRASDNTPLFDLCLFGSGSDLRGYEVGRYRDQRMVAFQGEYRFPLAGRFGAVVFGGSGKVARTFGEMGDEPDLWSVGAGLR
jgi:hypothetical protein